ncbi:hypothetical protein [Pseudogracilibacillus auburnensis]|uniref:hypothetical protein n=1 Tax=Pseudogracilibacillus auburnensis TaxID=1494959 RepID=UPI001A968D72|nr:hypothetical protein [Pseudogracilibacillus auburnensis]MBO1005806.1 hypothetical protein [Pseudogracilibacillus auburnensis]
MLPAIHLDLAFYSWTTDHRVSVIVTIVWIHHRLSIYDIDLFSRIEPLMTEVTRFLGREHT